MGHADVISTARPYRGARRRRGLFRDADGAVTVEFIIWIPVLLVILAFTADACLMYLIQADMWNVARDTARRMSTGQFTTNTAAQTYAGGQMLYPGKTYTITATGAGQAGVDKVIDVTLPISQAGVFGVLATFGSFTGATLEAKVTMRSEK